MARVWVKGYTRPDGTKVKGHYREVKGGAKKPLRSRLAFSGSQRSTSNLLARDLATVSEAKRKEMLAFMRSIKGPISKDFSDARKLYERYSKARKTWR